MCGYGFCTLMAGNRSRVHAMGRYLAHMTCTVTCTHDMYMSFSNEATGRRIAAAGATALLRAGDGIAERPGFTRSARWVFATGWSGSLICSGAISLLHAPGPRAATRAWRVGAQCVVATALMVGMPLARVSARASEAAFAGMSAMMGAVEFVAVQMDRIGFFRLEWYSSGETANARWRREEVGRESFSIAQILKMMNGFLNKHYSSTISAVPINRRRVESLF